MEIQIKNISGYQYYLVEFDYILDKHIIDFVLVKANELSTKVNPHSSGGDYRQSSTRINKLLGGLLTEVAVREILTQEARTSKITYQILGSTFIQEDDLEKLGFNQIDLQLLVQENKINIEIRSSFSYKTSLGRLFGFPLINNRGAFSIIGWYTSSNKPQELKKDYYVFGIHKYHPSEIMNKVRTKVELYIAGVVSKATLERIGDNNSLKQDGAKFRIINPIKNAPTPISGIKEILRIK